MIVIATLKGMPHLTTPLPSPPCRIVTGTHLHYVDSDGTQEYLCTDTDVVVVTKRTTTGWCAQSYTKLGAVRTAVIPD